MGVETTRAFIPNKQLNKAGGFGRFTNAEELLLRADKKSREEKDMDVGTAIWDIREEGVQEGISQGIKALVETCKELGHSKEEIAGKLVQKFTLSQSEAEKYVEDYGN